MKTYEISQITSAARRLAWDAAQDPESAMLNTTAILSRVFAATLTAPTTRLSHADRETVLRAFETAFNDNL